MKANDIRRARAGYYGSVTFIDTQIGRLLNWMSRFDGEALRNTWFVFTSDHGDMQGDHNLWRKTYAYEGSARIPFFIKPPGGSSRKIADEVVELRDVMPTLLEAAGVEIPPTVMGKSLVPSLNEKPEEWRNYIHGEHCWCYSPEQEMHYITNGKKKYIWFPRLDREQFFDLEKDPGECEDLISDEHHTDEVELWRGFLIAELEKRDCGWVKDGKLHCPEEPLVSPYKTTRFQG